MRTARSTNAPITAAVVAAFLTTGIAIAAQQPPTSGPPSPPADLNAVIALLEDGDATQLQKKQLVRKWYTGTVTVEDVVAERPDSPAQLIVAVKKGSRGNQDNFIEMAFEITDVERAAKLKKGSQVTVTGQLVGTSVRKTRYMHIGDVEVFQFRNVTMAESSGSVPAKGEPRPGQEQKTLAGPKATQSLQTASAQTKQAVAGRRN